MRQRNHCLIEWVMLILLALDAHTYSMEHKYCEIKQFLYDSEVIAMYRSFSSFSEQ